MKGFTKDGKFRPTTNPTRLTSKELQLKKDLIDGNLRLARISHDKNIKTEFKKMADAELQINIHELNKLRKKEGSN